MASLGAGRDDIIFDDTVSKPALDLVNKPHPSHPNCMKCKLHEGCKTPFISMEGGATAKLIVVGEAPGENEDNEGRPFVGKSGDLIRSVVEESEVVTAYTNAVRCRPEDNKRPTSKQIGYCKQFLEHDLKKSKANTVLLLGNVALQSVTGYNGITGWRGKVLRTDDKTYIPTYHPSYLLRNDLKDDIMSEWLNDIDKAFNNAKGIVEEEKAEIFKYIIIKDIETARDMFARLKRQKRASFDLEFRFLNAYRPGNAVLMASFAILNKEGTKGVAWALPLMHKDSPFTDNMDDLAVILDMLDEFARDDQIAKVGHNIKIDHLQMMAGMGIEVRGVDGDTMLISQLLDSRPGFHGLKQLAGKHLEMYDYSSELDMYVATHPEADYEQGGDYSKVPLEILAPYAAMDAAATILLERKMLPMLSGKLDALYRQMIVKASDVFTRIEYNGNVVDEDIVKEYTELYQAKSAELLEQMRQSLGVRRVERRINEKLITRYKAGKVKQEDYQRRYQKFNPASPDQVREVIYEYLEMPITAVTKTGKASVAAGVVKWYEDPWIDLYSEWKLYASALSKYLRPVLGWIGLDGRVRSQYSIIGTETGRTASRKPNMQNIPATEKYPKTLLESHPIKNIFRSTYTGSGVLTEDHKSYASWAGGCLMSVDFSAMEMRIMAAVSAARAMVKMFKEGKDPHTYVASKLHKVPESEVTKPMRYRAKWVNWTMLFGGGWFTLVRLYKLTEKEARELEAGWYAIFPEVLEYAAETIEATKKNGYSESPLGRRRYLPYIYHEEEKKVRKAEREATNNPIQSAASDVLMMSLVIIDMIMQEHKVKSMIINTVHDSIVFDIYPGELEFMHNIAVDVMTNIKQYAVDYFPDVDLTWLTVPLMADADVGIHYGSLKPYKPHEESVAA